MKLDFHTHGKLAKRLPFSTVYTDWLFGEAKNAGLDALCLTEHFNTLQFDELYGYLSTRSTREGDALVLENGLRVFPGMETDIAEGGHVLSIGPLEAILELNQRLAPHKAPGNFLPFAQLRDLFDQYPVVVGGAHPYREGGHIPQLPREQLARLDFLDLNGKDLATDRQQAEQRTYGLGRQLGVPVVSGSDTHQAVQYGCVWTEFQRECSTAGRKIYHHRVGKRGGKGKNRQPAEAGPEGDSRPGRGLCGGAHRAGKGPGARPLLRGADFRAAQGGGGGIRPQGRNHGGGVGGCCQ